MVYIVEEFERLAAGAVTAGTNNLASAIAASGGGFARANAIKVGYAVVASDATTAQRQLRFTTSSAQLQRTRLQIGVASAAGITEGCWAGLALLPTGIGTADAGTTQRVVVYLYRLNGTLWLYIGEAVPNGINVNTKVDATKVVADNSVLTLDVTLTGQSLTTVLTNNGTRASVTAKWTLTGVTGSGLTVAALALNGNLGTNARLERVQLATTPAEMPAAGVMVVEDFQTLPSGTVTQAWASGRPGVPSIMGQAGAAVSWTRAPQDPAYGYGVYETTAAWSALIYATKCRAMRIVGSLTNTGGTSVNGSWAGRFSQANSYPAAGSAGAYDAAAGGLDRAVSDSWTSYMDHAIASGTRTVGPKTSFTAQEGAKAGSYSFIMDVWIDAASNTINSRWDIQPTSTTVPISPSGVWQYRKSEALTNDPSLNHYAAMTLGASVIGGKRLWRVTLADDISALANNSPVRWWDGSATHFAKPMGIWDGSKLVPMADINTWWDGATTQPVKWFNDA